MDSAILKIIDQIKGIPEIKYTNTDDSITVNPKDVKGFSVTFEVSENEFIVSASFWHELFNKHEVDEALNCFALLLSDHCRLQIEYRGEKVKKCTIEYIEDGRWQVVSRTVLFNFRIRQPTRVEYFQNRLIKMNEVQSGKPPTNA